MSECTESMFEHLSELTTENATLTAELAEAREQRDSLREALREAVGWNWLDDDAPPLDVVLKIDAALSASGLEGE